MAGLGCETMSSIRKVRLVAGLGYETMSSIRKVRLGGRLRL